MTNKKEAIIDAVAMAVFAVILAFFALVIGVAYGSDDVLTHALKGVFSLVGIGA